MLTLANSCEDFVVRAHEQERRGEQVVDGHVQFSGQSGHGTLRIVKLVSIIDEHTRECLTSLVERSVTADALIDELDRLALTRGYPAVLRCDNGPELACEAMADWAGEHVVLSFIPPGEPWRNGYVESFNGRVRDDRDGGPLRDEYTKVGLMLQELGRSLSPIDGPRGEASKELNA